MHFRSDSWRFVARVTDQSSFEKYWILGKWMNYDLSQDYSLSCLLAMQILGQQVSLSTSQWLWAAFGGKWSHEAGVRAGRGRELKTLRWVGHWGWPMFYAAGTFWGALWKLRPNQRIILSSWTANRQHFQDARWQCLEGSPPWGRMEKPTRQEVRSAIAQ